MSIRRRALHPALALLLVTACGLGDDRSCTLIGGESGVNFWVIDWLPEHPEATHAKACVEGECRTEELNGLNVFFPLDRDGPDTVRVALTLLDAEDRALFDASTSVRRSKVEPNGPGCDPLLWRATVAPTDSGTLVQRPQSARR